MTKILYVYGDDYAACDYEKLRKQNLINPADLWTDAGAEGPREYESEQEYFEYTALEFGFIDPEFIDFVKNELIDYDAGKTANFYVVE